MKEVLAKVLSPVQVLVFASSVDDAAKIVIGEAPVKETPLMVLPVARVVAVLALPPIERVEVATSSNAVPAEFEYNIRLPVMEPRPVPPPPIPSVPDSDGVQLSVLAVPMIVSETVNPLKDDVVVPMVTVELEAS